jgi:acyl carrier protein
VSDQELIDIFTRILRDLIGNESIVLAGDMGRGDVDGWDSFVYVNFIVAVEMELGIKFRVAEVEAFETVGEIVARAQALLGR